jgi:large subunit ribosomal protein L6
MSRIGKLPIQLPEKVTVNIDADNTVTVKGPLGELKQKVNPAITLEVKDNEIFVSRSNEEKENRYFLLLSRYKRG